MIFGAVIFGFFGFYMFGRSVTQPAFFMEMFVWTLRATAVLFAVSAVITFVRPFPGNLLYATTGVVSAVLFTVVVVLDYLDKQRMLFPYSTFIVLFFAAWNGFGSATALRNVHAAMRAQA
jgi:hypothetical protein